MLIKVKVIPKSSQNIIIPENEIFKIKMTTAPEKGKANSQLIKLLAQHFKVSKSKIEIISGLTSRHKLVKIEMK